MARVTIASLQAELKVFRDASYEAEKTAASVAAHHECAMERMAVKIRFFEDQLASAHALVANMVVAQPTTHDIKPVVRIPAVPVGHEKPQPIDFSDYWTYVHAAKSWCKQARKPVSYATKEQFRAQQDSYDEMLDAGAANYLEFPQGEFAPQCNVGPLS